MHLRDPADWVRTSRRAERGAGTRIALVAAALAIGVVLALVTRQWSDAWHHFVRFE